MIWVVLHHLVAASAPMWNRDLGSHFSTSSGRQIYCWVFGLKHIQSRSKTHVLGSFAPFGCSKCTIPKSDHRMPFRQEFRPMKLFSRFSAKMHPIHYVWSKAHVLGGFPPFGCRMWTVAKSGHGMPFGHEFGQMKLLSSFSAERLPIH